MEMLQVIEAVEQRAALKIVERAEDYIKDGLLYCGKCHTPKQHIGECMGVKRKVLCLCECRMQELKVEEQQRQWEKQQERIKAYRKVGFTESDMQGWTFAADDGVNPRITKALKSYVNNFNMFKEQGKGLLLYGGVGTGKTFGAACVVNALIDKGVPCLITSFARVLNTLWCVEDKQAYIDSLNRFDLLVLDDLGAERNSEYAQEQVFNVIDARYRLGLPLIITTNLSIEDIKKTDSLSNQRIYDRVLAMCHPVEVKGMSRRRKKVALDFKSMNEMLGL